MPAFIGGVKIVSNSSAGVIIMGDSIYISPKSTNKTYEGSGGGATGDFPVTNTFNSIVITLDNDIGGVAGEFESSLDT